MPQNRRTFAQGLAVLALAASPTLARARRRVLMLGGTNYVGPWLVRAALARGHEVVLFNRGRTNPHLFPDLERIRGDRTMGPPALAPLVTRDWDIVLDTWQQAPRAVEESVAALRGRTGVYAYVSSIAVYGGFRKIGLDEQDPRLDPSPRDFGQDDYGYPLNKSLAEKAVERGFGRRGLIVRGGAIQGRDLSGSLFNQSVYWALRMRAGGEVLVPDDRSALMQYSDVRALTEFMVRRADTDRGGLFNAVSKPIPLLRYLETVRSVTGARARLVPVAPQFLIERGALPFEVVPFWIPGDDPEPGFYRVSGDRAQRAGFRSYSLSENIKGTLASLPDLPTNGLPEFKNDWAPTSVRGIPVALEREILADWKSAARTPISDESR